MLDLLGEKVKECSMPRKFFTCETALCNGRFDDRKHEQQSGRGV